MKQNLEQIFTKDEIKTIQRFMNFVASDNQQNQSNFSVTETETDETVKQEVKEWLENRYKKGHGRRKQSA
jgi:hypothetical protein